MVDTVQTVLHFLMLHEDFEAALVATVNQGDDADTTGALVGMLAGARCGAAQAAATLAASAATCYRAGHHRANQRPVGPGTKSEGIESCLN